MKHPVDYDNLSKGDIIPQSLIEEILGVSSINPSYRLKTIGLRNLIEREMYFRGNPVTIVCLLNNLKILTDEESSIYNFKQGLSYLSRFQSRHEHILSTVDISNLGQAEKVKHLRRVEISSRFAFAINHPAKMIMAEERKEQLQTPAIEQIKRLSW